MQIIIKKKVLSIIIANIIYITYNRINSYQVNREDNFFFTKLGKQTQQMNSFFLLNFNLLKRQEQLYR